MKFFSILLAMMFFIQSNAWAAKAAYPGLAKKTVDYINSLSSEEKTKLYKSWLANRPLEDKEVLKDFESKTKDFSSLKLKQDGEGITTTIEGEIFKYEFIDLEKHLLKINGVVYDFSPGKLKDLFQTQGTFSFIDLVIPTAHASDRGLGVLAAGILLLIFVGIPYSGIVRDRRITKMCEELKTKLRQLKVEQLTEVKSLAYDLHKIDVKVFLDKWEHDDNQCSKDLKTYFIELDKLDKKHINDSTIIKDTGSSSSEGVKPKAGQKASGQ